MTGKIGILGPEHTFTDLAADWYIQRFSTNNTKVFYDSIWDVFDALKTRKVEKGIVPIENSIHGTVRETFDALFRSDLHILLRFAVPVHHCIAVKKGTKKSEVVKVVSHQQALSQSRKYLRKNLPKAQQIGFSSTAAAIKNLISTKSLNKAVICSGYAAKEYNLRILDRNIEDQKGNKTWFAVLGREMGQNEAGKNIRTSIAFHFQKDSPGTLFGVFKDFNDAKINMTKIESRPAPKKWGDYIFFLDFEGGINAAKVKKVLKSVEKKVAKLKIFGSYKVIN